MLLNNNHDNNMNIIKKQKTINNISSYKQKINITEKEFKQKSPRKILPPIINKNNFKINKIHSIPNLDQTTKTI